MFFLFFWFLTVQGNSLQADLSAVELQPLEEDSQQVSADVLLEVNLLFLQHKPNGWQTCTDPADAVAPRRKLANPQSGLPCSGGVTCIGGHVTIRCPAKQSWPHDGIVWRK